MREQSCCFLALSHFQFSPPGKFLCAFGSLRSAAAGLSATAAGNLTWQGEIIKINPTKPEQSWAVMPAVQRLLIKQPCFQASLAFPAAAGPYPVSSGVPPSFLPCWPTCRALPSLCQSPVWVYPDLLHAFDFSVSFACLSFPPAFCVEEWIGERSSGRGTSDLECQGVSSSVLVPLLSSPPAEQPW